MSTLVGATGYILLALSLVTGGRLFWCGFRHLDGRMAEIRSYAFAFLTLSVVFAGLWALAHPTAGPDRLLDTLALLFTACIALVAVPAAFGQALGFFASEDDGK